MIWDYLKSFILQFISPTLSQLLKFKQIKISSNKQVKS